MTSASKAGALREMREANAVATELASLAKKINDEHEAAERAINESLLHAKRCGEHLIEAKANVEHGEWSAWLEENFRATHQTATGYMRIARKWETLPPQNENASSFSIREALAFLSDPRSAPAPPSSDKEPDKYRDHLDNEAAWSPAKTESVKGPQPAYDEIMGRAEPPVRADDDAPLTDGHVGTSHGIPEGKRPKPRENIAHVMAVVEAATGLGKATDEQIAAVPFNDLMGERLRSARDVIDRILTHHDRKST